METLFARLRRDIVEVLNKASRETERVVIGALEEIDSEMAEEIKKRMFVFEDIVLIDSPDIQKVIKQASCPELAKALKSVDTEVQDKIFRNMSKEGSRLLKEEMEYMGPIPPKVVEQEQQKIAGIILSMEKKGEITIPYEGE